MKTKRILTTLMLPALALTMLQAVENYDESAEEAAIYEQELREAHEATDYGLELQEEHADRRTPTNKPLVKNTPKVKRAGWYMRTKVTATAADGTVYRHGTAGVFGKLKQSNLKKDRHDIPAYGAATFQVVFPHYDWDDASGDYFSDYRKKVGKRAVWAFLVRNQQYPDLSNAPIKIELEGQQNVDFIKKDGKITYIETDLLPQKRNRFTLVDVDNQKTYRYDELENANLTMDGSHRRAFRWVKGKVRKKDFNPVPEPGTGK